MTVIAELTAIRDLLVEGADIAEQDRYDNNVMGECALRIDNVIYDLQEAQPE